LSTFVFSYALSYGVIVALLFIFCESSEKIIYWGDSSETILTPNFMDHLLFIYLPSILYAFPLAFVIYAINDVYCNNKDNREQKV